MIGLGRMAAGVVRAYQCVLSPLLPQACRFAPTCSEYARVVLIEQGLIRGLALAVWRIARCHPLNPGGWDPPPARHRAT